jgi:Ca-activated chloride channel family protein
MPIPVLNLSCACALLSASLLLLSSSLVFAQQSPDVEDVHVAPRTETDKPDPKSVAEDSVRPHSPTIRSKVDLVLVPVTVTDPMNRLVTGLDKENFQVFEGKDRQDVRHFSSEDAPISLGVIFDMSGSMGVGATSPATIVATKARTTSISAIPVRREARSCEALSSIGEYGFDGCLKHALVN